MSEPYAREILRRNVAQICQTIGWNGINSTPLEILTHVLERYIQSLATQTSRYSEQFNRTHPNLNDLGLVFRDLNVHLPELADYVRCVPPVPPPIQVDKFPKPKESNLNFLKPGSHEVVTRPMHVHEHLPPMYPEKERETPAVAGTVEIKQNGIDNAETSGAITSATCESPEISVTDSPEKPKDLFKRPNDPVTIPSSKRPRLRLEEEERTREISSVMMTMSGFLSPAREGKLPEARPPATISEKHDKHPSLHTSGTPKDSVFDKSDKKSKKNKLLNGKIMKSKRKDKSHKSESSKSKDGSKFKRHNSDRNAKKSKILQDALKQLASLTPKGFASPVRPVMPPPVIPVPEPMRPIKQEPIDPVPTVSTPVEDTIPVPRKIPISKSPLVSTPTATKTSGFMSSFIPEKEIKKEIIDEDEKLTSQPDRSKINIFKKISNKSKEDKNNPEIVSDSPHPDTMISKLQNTSQEKIGKESTRIKSASDASVNNNEPCAVDFSKEMDLRAHEVISIDDDSSDASPALHLLPEVTSVNTSVSQSLQIPHSKDLSSGSPKIKKEKKHKDKKDKAAKLEAKLIKRQQQQLAAAMAQTAEADKKDWKKVKPPKQSRPKKEKSQLPPGFPFFSGVPGPGLIPIIPNNDFLTGLASNPALRGLPPSSLLTNPFALSAGGPGLIPRPGLFPGSGLPNPLMHMGNFPQSSRSSSSVKLPTILRRPSLEVIPVDDDRTELKPELSIRDKDRRDKHKSPTIPNILQKHKSNKLHKEHKSSLYKMPLVQPDITIQLNPPKPEPIRREPPTATVQSPPEPIPQTSLMPPPAPAKAKSPEVNQEKTITESPEKKKDKPHKKEKKDKDGLKIKKKKDKKDKNKEKSDKKKDKDELKMTKDKVKKEKKEKKKEKEKEKEKSQDGLVPKLTLKLGGSSNSNSPMPPSPPDSFKLNIKPVVKKEEEEESPFQKEEPISREHSRSPELAQISALVTRPPKQKHSKHNNSEPEPQTSSSPPLAAPSPPRKNRPPSSHSKYKRILFKPLSKKGHFDDETASTSEEAGPQPSSSDKLPPGPLPTPYYVDDHGNKVWVCPACVRPDNGSPMIGCDGCDGWYHWVCVGITEEPGATEDWFCKSCLAKRAAMVLAGVTSGKKRGRKPKGEKVRDCN